MHTRVCLTQTAVFLFRVSFDRVAKTLIADGTVSSMRSAGESG